MRKKILISLVTVALATLPLSTAQANGEVGYHAYLSAPWVQGSPLTSDFTIETFDNMSVGPLPADLAVGKFSGDGQVTNIPDFGGASSTSGAPYQGGVPTNYATTSSNTPLTIDLPNPAKYVGFWWTAGDNGNTFTLFKQGKQVATVNIDNLRGILAPAKLTALDGTTQYDNSQYLFNPVNTLNNPQQYVFVSFYAVGGTSFDRIVFSGPGFEFDNVTVSEVESQPAASMVDFMFTPGVADPMDNSGGTPEVTNKGDLANTGSDALPIALAGITLTLAGATIVARSRKATKREVTR